METVMGDLRNKMAKLARDERHRQYMARNYPKAHAPPHEPECAGCGLKGIYNRRPDGAYVSMYVISGRRRGDESKILCENCAPPDAIGR
jgi:hypothetical protein